MTDPMPCLMALTQAFELGCDHPGRRIYVGPSRYAWCQSCYDVRRFDRIRCACCGERDSLTLDIFISRSAVFIYPLCPTHSTREEPSS